VATTSCRTASGPEPTETPATDTVVSTTPPFRTKEPEQYSATRTITAFGPNGEKFVGSILIGRDGPIRREEATFQQTRIVYLDTPDGRLILWPEQKVYAVQEDDSFRTPRSETEDDSPARLLHTEPSVTTYQYLGTDTVAGRNTTKYRVVVNSSATENVNANETLIWIDTTLNMPIKSEMKSRDGVVVVTELSDLTVPPDKQLFQIPAGYEKIPFSALQKQLKARELNP
jgi:outer membrane lipoprotein-sorting protein